MSFPGVGFGEASGGGVPPPSSVTPAMLVAGTTPGQLLVTDTLNAFQLSPVPVTPPGPAAVFALAGDLADPTRPVVVVQGTTGQSGSLQEWQLANGQVVMTVDASGNVTIAGDFTVDGTTTTINSTVVDVADRVIHMNASSGANDPVPSNICGFSVHRGAIAGAPRDHAGVFWVEASSKFQFAMNTGGDDSTLGVDVAVQALSVTAANFVTNSAGSSFVTFGSGAASAISAVGTSRIRYNAGTGFLQASINGAAYQNFTFGGLTGGGTGNRVAKFNNPTTTQLDNSNITDDGTNISVSQNGTLSIQRNTAGVAASTFIQATGASMTLTNFSAIQPSISGSVTEWVGYLMGGISSGTFTNIYGLKVIQSGVGTNRYSLYSDGVNTQLFNAGPVEFDRTLSLIGGDNTKNWFEIAEGQNAPVSTVDRGRIRYNQTTQKFQVSQNAGAYVDMVGVSGTGTVNTVPKVTSATGPVYGDSVIVDNGTGVTVSPTGVTISGLKVDVALSASAGTPALLDLRNSGGNASNVLTGLAVTNFTTCAYWYGAYLTANPGGGTTASYGVYVTDLSGTTGYAFYYGSGVSTPTAAIDKNGAFVATTSLSLKGSTSGTTVIAVSATASSFTYTLPTTNPTAGQVLSSDGSGNLSWVTSSGSPAGADMQIQFYNSGSFGASAGLTWDGTSVGITNGIYGLTNASDFSVTGYAPITGAGQSVVISGGNSADDTGGSVTLKAGTGTTNGELNTWSELLSIKNISGSTTLATFSTSGAILTVIGGETRLEGDLRLYGNGTQGKITDSNGTTRIILNTGSGNTVEFYDASPTLRMAIEQGSSTRFYDTTVTLAFSIDDTNINVGKHMLPLTDNLYDLGSSSFKFKDGYFAGKLTVDGPIDPTYVEFTQIVTPSNPAAGKNRLYFVGDNLYMLNNAGSETQVNGGTPGGINKDIQYNNSGSFGGSTNFVFDASNPRFEFKSPTLTVAPLNSYSLTEVFSVSASVQANSFVTYLSLFESDFYIDTPAGSTPDQFAAGYFYLGLDFTANNTQYTSVQRGVHVYVDHNVSGGSSIFQDIVAIDTEVHSASTASSGNMFGLRVQTKNESSGSLSQMFGLYTKPTNNGTITNTYGLYIAGGSGSFSAEYGIYQEANSTNSRNWFNARFTGFGESAPVSTERVFIEPFDNSSMGLHIRQASLGQTADLTRWADASDNILVNITATGDLNTQNILPVANNTSDLGSASFKFKDGYFAGKLTVDGLIDPSGLLLTNGTGETPAAGLLIWNSGAAKFQMCLDGSTFTDVPANAVSASSANSWSALQTFVDGNLNLTSNGTNVMQLYTQGAGGPMEMKIGLGGALFFHDTLNIDAGSNNFYFYRKGNYIILSDQNGATGNYKYIDITDNTATWQYSSNEP